MDYQLHPASDADDAFLEELFAQVRGPEFASLVLDASASAQLLSFQFRAQNASYTASFPGMESSILWVGPTRAGRVLVYPSPVEIRIVDIALLPAFRGQGIGGEVLKALQQRAQAAGLSLRLSVRKENPATRLYGRLGFVSVEDGDGVDISLVWKPQGVSPGLTGAYFQSIQGRTIRARLRDGAEGELTLTAVTVPRALQYQGTVLDDSFTLQMEGPESFSLSQGIYAVDFGDSFVAEIFIVPVSAENGKRQYESVFNRTHRPG